MATQVQMYYQAHAKIAEANLTFLELVKDGMTREELQKNIDRRPSLWGRYANWLKTLPSSADRPTPQPA